MADDVEQVTRREDLEQDPELQAMMRVFGVLKQLDSKAQIRVLEYVEQRLRLERHQRPSLLRERSIDTFETTKSQRQAPGEEEEAQRVSPPPDLETEEAEEEDSGGLAGISPVASRWMQRSGLTASRMSALFSLGIDEIDLVAKKIPGSSARERLRNVMLLLGIASYLNSGAPRIDNDKLREATRHYQADVGGNFNRDLKTWSAEISGSRAARDLTLTTRGLNSAKDLIKGMTPEDSA